MRIVLFVNSAKTFFWHRKSLADRLLSQGHEVIVVCSRDGDIDRFAQEPYKTVFLDMSRKGMNPLKELFIFVKMLKTFAQLKADVCHNFTIKCVIYGSLAQRLVGINKIINSITGLGIVFVRGGLLQKFVEMLYRFVFFISRSRVIFQNPDDMNFFIKSGMVNQLQTHLIYGSGVNTETFYPVTKDFSIPRIVFASRLLKSKGVLDLLNASVSIMNMGIQHELLIAGEFDPMSPDTLKEEDLEPFRCLEHVKILGNVSRIDDLLKECHVACFPSYYREGVPKFLIEAASSGLAIITTDTPGCREVIEDNGYLIPPHDPEALQSSLEKLLSSAQLMEQYGEKSREIALKKFSEKHILCEIISLYE